MVAVVVKHILVVREGAVGLGSVVEHVGRKEVAEPFFLRGSNVLAALETMLPAVLVLDVPALARAHRGNAMPSVDLATHGQARGES